MAEIKGRNASLQQIPRQGLILSAQMQQKLQLLQMGFGDLDHFINEEIERNPYLSRLYDTSPNMVGTATPSAMAALEPLDLAHINQGPTLQQYLCEQINSIFPKQEQRHIAVYLSEQLDKSGYFIADLDQCADLLGVTVDLVLAIFSQLQTFDPPGLFARTLAECLELQLKRQNLFDPVFARLLQGLDLLGRRDYEALARKCGISEEALRQRLAQIRKLDPKPGLAFDHTHDRLDNPVLIADVFVDIFDDETLNVALNPATLPKVIINEDYSKIVGTTATERQFIKHSQSRAHWLIRTLDERARSMLTISTAIMKAQKAFLHEGATALKPLTLANIAAETGFHLSTISRAIAGKYARLRKNGKDQGIYALRHFFSAALGNRSRKVDFATKAIEARLAQMITTEQMPLTDADLVNALKQEGILISRRTIAKYRQNLRLASSHQRKRAKRL